jgi:hypothetical protein
MYHFGPDQVKYTINQIPFSNDQFTWGGLLKLPKSDNIIQVITLYVIPFSSADYNLVKYLLSSFIVHAKN